MTKPMDNIVSIGVCNYGMIKNMKDFQRLESTEPQTNSFSTQDHHLVSEISWKFLSSLYKKKKKNSVLLN